MEFSLDLAAWDHEQVVTDLNPHQIKNFLTTCNHKYVIDKIIKIFLIVFFLGKLNTQ